MECPVCYSSLSNFVTFSCKHNICTSCFYNMIKINNTEYTDIKCPLCCNNALFSNNTIITIENIINNLYNKIK